MEEHTGIHLEITLRLKIDWPKTTGAQFIEIMDRMCPLDSLDMGDAAGALVQAYTEGKLVFTMDADQIFDWTGTSEDDLQTGLRYNAEDDTYETVLLKPQAV